MITGINESKTLTNHISYECKCRFDERKCNSDQWWSNDKCRCECAKPHVCENDHVGNPATCSCENEKYLASTLGDSAIACDEVIESYDEDVKTTLYDETKTIPTNFNERKYYSIIDSCQHLLLSDKILHKTKTPIIIYYHFNSQITNYKKLCIKNINKK